MQVLLYLHVPVLVAALAHLDLQPQHSGSALVPMRTTPQGPSAAVDVLCCSTGRTAARDDLWELFLDTQWAKARTPNQQSISKTSGMGLTGSAAFAGTLSDLCTGCWPSWSAPSEAPEPDSNK